MYPPKKIKRLFTWARPWVGQNADTTYSKMHTPIQIRTSHTVHVCIHTLHTYAGPHIHKHKHIPTHSNTHPYIQTHRAWQANRDVCSEPFLNHDHKFIIHHDFFDWDGPVCTPTSFGLAAKCQQCIRSLPHLNNHIWSWLWTFLLKASYMPYGACAQVNPWIVPMRFSTLERSVPFSSLMPQPHLHIEPSRMSHARWCLQKSADIQKNPSCTVIWTL